MLFEFTILLTILLLFHTIADFVLQNTYHLGKFKKNGWLLPLLSHSFQHSYATAIGFVLFMLIFGYYGNITLYYLVATLSVVNMIIHTIVDRMKANPTMIKKYPYPSKAYFVLLGLDQYAHTVTAILIGYIFITSIN